MDKGYSALRSPAQLLAALSQLKEAYRTERPYFSTDIGEFYTWLKEEVEEPKLEELRRVLRTFIVENYPLRPGSMILGREVHKGKRMTFSDARQISGIARARMEIALRHLHGAGLASATVISDVKADDIRAVDDFWAGLCNLKDAAKALSVHPAQMKSLIAAGVLEAVRLKSALRYVTRASMEAVLKRIDALPVAQPSKEILLISEFSQSRCVSMAKVLKAVQDGEIRHVYRSRELTGIRSILIDNGESPIRQRRRHYADMSIAEAAEHLQISPSGIRELRDSGYLEQVHRKNPDTNHQRAFITIGSIVRFEAEYETWGQIAARIGIRNSPIVTACLSLR